MTFPRVRHRRLRQNEQFRSLVRETAVSSNDLVAPLFLVAGSGVKKPISSLVGQNYFSPDTAIEEAKLLRELGINAVLLFGLCDEKDEVGSYACRDDAVVQQATELLKREVPSMLIMADLCFCEYTSHGHCGVVVNEKVDNDLTLMELQKQALSLAKAGVDVIAPSGMMDGMVLAIRQCLDENNFVDTAIMSYAAKYASAYYGPFREAVDSTPSFGNRKTYQMDPANGDEALREVASDITEGADIVMVKPALAYLDVIWRVKQTFSLPLAAYNVSGEYAMIKAAGAKGLIDENAVIAETLLSIKRAGADIIITYFAKKFAAWQRAG
ncbi:MAG: porphobilinogen synthase [Deltaproteobacteria bacterium]|nr:porphobilinogen synthase [Deltaproteobacteria bacterium]